MVDESKLDIRKVLEEGSQSMPLSSLASVGVRRVKVLDEQTIQELIRRAVDQVISTQTEEERSRILADSRQELTKLLNERDQSMSRASQLESGRNQIAQRVDELQAELRLRRQAWDQAEATLRSQIKELADRRHGLEDRIQPLQTENARLREQRDHLEEELTRTLDELRSLTEEVASLRAAVAGQSGLRGELETSQAALNELKNLLAERDGSRAELQRRLDEALEEIERVKRERVPEPEAGGGAAGAGETPEPLEDLESLVEIVPVQAAAACEPAESGAARRTAAGPSQAKQGKGLDVGTVNLVAAEQNEQGEVETRLKRNVFIDVEITPYTKGMLLRLGVPYVVQGKRMYVLGEPAFELANVLNRNTRRPMRDGLISPKEQDALPIMKLLIGSILGEPRIPQEVCFYSVPGDPVDSDMSVAYHRDLFDAVLRALGYKPSHVIEGHAVTFAELGEEDFTGIGISCGGGMFNVCVAYKSMPALTFSTARSGDWVDMNVAQVLGIKPAKAALLKEKGVDLTNPKTREEDAVAIYYRNLIKYNLTNIAERFKAAESMPTFKEPISIVFSGGTAMAGHFIELVQAVFKELDFPIPVKEIRIARDPLHATVRGALVAAQLEMAQASG